MALPRSLALRSLSLPFAAALVAGVLLWSGSRAAAATPGTLARNDAIEQAMGQLQQSMKALGKGISAETKDAALAELGKMQAALLAAKTQVPDTAAAVDEKKRPDFVAEYRTTLLEVLKHTADAEIAVVNGKYKEAEAVLRGKLGALKSAGHDKFKGEEH